MLDKLGDWLFGYVPPAVVFVLVVVALSIQEYGLYTVEDWVVLALLVAFMGWAVGICWYFTWQWRKSADVSCK